MFLTSQGGQAEGLRHSSRGHRPRNEVFVVSLRPVRALQTLLCAFVPSRPCVKKSRNCETNPISFKTRCPSITNNEEISFLIKSKSYDGEDRAPCGTKKVLPTIVFAKQVSICGSRQINPFPSCPNLSQHFLEKKDCLKSASICGLEFGSLWKAIVGYGRPPGGPVSGRQMQGYANLRKAMQAPPGGDYVLISPKTIKKTLSLTLN
jgi:hypothetical protein